VVTIRSLEGVPIEDLTVDLFKRWGVGPKGENRGVLVLLAVSDRKYRTEVGYGLEPILPDGKVGGFGREMVPLLRQRDYGGALLQMTQRIAATIAEDRRIALQSLPASNPPGEAGKEAAPPHLHLGVLLLLLFFLFLLGSLVRRAAMSGAARGRPGSLWPFLFLGPGSGGGWGQSGSWGGGFGSGGGFGGFGGGFSGGGGASGSW